MVTVRINTGEVYPAYTIASDEQSGDATVEVDEETAARWRELQVQHDQMRHQIFQLLDPPCPECGHPTSRHQEWSEGWDRWGCLGWGGPCKMRCQHGMPANRQKEND